MVRESQRLPETVVGVVDDEVAKSNVRESDKRRRRLVVVVVVRKEGAG